MWWLSIALEKEEIVEESFYSLIETADSEYYSLDDKLAGLLETYFIDIHTALIDVVKDWHYLDVSYTIAQKPLWEYSYFEKCVKINLYT